MSPTDFVVQMARLDEQLEAAHRACDFPRLQLVLGEQASLLRSMYGHPQG